jgi:hypothetical protein
MLRIMLIMCTIRAVREVVGELDFSFHIVSTAASSSSTLIDGEKSKSD